MHVFQIILVFEDKTKVEFIKVIKNVIFNILYHSIINKKIMFWITGNRGTYTNTSYSSKYIFKILICL